MFSEFARSGDPALRSELVEAHIGLAHHLARRFVYRGEPYDDLVQVGSLALIKAVDRFDPERGRGIHDVRQQDDPGGAQAPLPGQGMGHPGPPAPAGAVPPAQPLRGVAVAGARSVADDRRARGGHRCSRGAGVGGARGRAVVPLDVTRQQPGPTTRASDRASASRQKRWRRSSGAPLSSPMSRRLPEREQTHPAAAVRHRPDAVGDRDPDWASARCTCRVCWPTA